MNEYNKLEGKEKQTSKINVSNLFHYKEEELSKDSNKYSKPKLGNKMYLKISNIFQTIHL